jgi:hypothetical protein
MSESVAQRTAALAQHVDAEQLYKLLTQIQADLAALRAQVNAHVHSGVTAGAANTGAPTTTLASLNTQP